MERVRNKMIGTKVGMNKDVLQETEEHQLRWYGHVMRMGDCRIARLVAVWNPTGKKGGAADQSIHGGMGLGTACKGETLRMKNVSIESSGGRKVCLWVEKNCVFKENSYIYKTMN
jgi:hypothetical protein